MRSTTPEGASFIVGYRDHQLIEFPAGSLGREDTALVMDVSSADSDVCVRRINAHVNIDGNLDVVLH